MAWNQTGRRRKNSEGREMGKGKRRDKWRGQKLKSKRREASRQKRENERGEEERGQSERRQEIGEQTGEKGEEKAG